ncbi:hypothetical protein [Ancylobacter oerskovii]|uniref:DUF2946 domain-containing protein n=1 Tax=Ancylobacter oerskovii TaxID=459519 RepID=A0ABW4YRF0_9HYPH|nr:hypothetical protein [Ancylobacter oerskovii]MBS7545589.1 hypothetical protein [Ancylobacter oerskovii]
MASRRLAFARLIAALFALAFTLAGPVTAASAMAVRLAAPVAGEAPAGAMPCHESAAARAEAALGHAGDGTMARVDAGMPAKMAHEGSADGNGALSHLCCVLTCLMVPPLDAALLATPLAVSAAPKARPAAPLFGTGLARPDPPPRTT